MTQDRTPDRTPDEALEDRSPVQDQASLWQGAEAAASELAMAGSRAEEEAAGGAQSRRDDPPDDDGATSEAGTTSTDDGPAPGPAPAPDDGPESTNDDPEPAPDEGGAPPDGGGERATKDETPTAERASAAVELARPVEAYRPVEPPAEAEPPDMAERRLRAELRRQAGSDADRGSPPDIKPKARDQPVAPDAARPPEQARGDAAGPGGTGPAAARATGSASPPRVGPIPAADATAAKPATGAPPGARTSGPTPSPDRTVDARLARLHLRGGLITLARAELETMAGLGILDREALADLAEARWRSGDLVGAGEAARAHLEAGGTEPMAMVVASEALAAEGRFVESRQFATRVVERAPGLVERLFAGQSRSHAWGNLDSDPADREDIATWGLLSGGEDVINPGRHLRRARPPGQPRDAEGRPLESPHIAPRAAGMLTGPAVDRTRQTASQPGGASPERATAGPRPQESTVPGSARPTDAQPPRGAPAAPPMTPRGSAPGDRPTGTVAPGPTAGGRTEPGTPTGRPSSTEQAMEIGRRAGRELGAIEDAIGRGETASIAARLALVLRLDRALAPMILSLADRAVARSAPDDPEVPALHLVRGDAYRVLGREAEATAAFQRSRLALDASPTNEEQA